MIDEQSEPPDEDSAPSQSEQPQVLPLVALWSLVVAVVGGYGCGLVIRWFKVLGSVSLLVLGVLAGYVAKRLLYRQSRLVGAMLVVACAIAGLFAITNWIYHNERAGLESWWESLKFVPSFVKFNAEFAIVTAVCTAIGAAAAFYQVARRRRFDTDDS